MAYLIKAKVGPDMFRDINKVRRNNHTINSTAEEKMQEQLQENKSLFFPLNHMLNMEVDLQILFAWVMSRDVHSCTHWLRPRLPPSPAFGLVLRGRYWSAKITE
jgi:hypothetical protein